MPFIDPRIIAIGRSSSWDQSQSKPSFISARKFGLTFGFALSTFVIGFVIVVIVESSATATKNEAASKKNGTNTPIAIKKLPRGGPIKLFVSDSADHIWPFAFSSCSSFTTDGIKVWAVLSRKTSAQPKRKEAVIATI